MAQQAAEIVKNLPPMLQQYLVCKQLHPDALVLYQVGDFYEAFFDDAVTLSRSLNLTLTSRDKGSDNPIPMAGVPLAVIDNYACRLVDLGKSVAIYSQVTSDGKTFDRQLERMITPGIRILSNLSDGQPAGIVLAVVPEKNISAGQNFSLAYSALQDAQIFSKTKIPAEDLPMEVARIAAQEIIVPVDFDRRQGWIKDLENANSQSTLKFRSLKNHDFRDFNKIEGYALADFNVKQAVQLLLSYVDEVTVNSQLNFQKISEEANEDFLIIDSNTRRNLELLQGQWTGNIAGSLYTHLNRTVSAGGSRLLANWLSKPLKDLEQILSRQQALGYLIENSEVLQQIKKSLAGHADLERFASRLQLRVVLPSELGSVRDTLLAVATLRRHLSNVLQQHQEQSLLLSLVGNLDSAQNLLQLLNESLADTPPSNFKEAGIFKAGFNSELDELIELCEGGAKRILELEKKAQQQTGVSSLKIKFNNVLGYFFEVGKTHAAKLKDEFISRQSTANTERFFTTELKELESKVTKAASTRLNLEKKLFEELRTAARIYIDELRELGNSLAYLDSLQALADVSLTYGYVKPTLLTEPTLEIEGGKHPILAASLGNEFISNDLMLPSDHENFVILTGPNMGGKSTYLRQAALLVIMAHLGSYIPASRAKIGLCDRIFARIGASDNLLEGQSTFMLEMREAAQIMASATSSSLILIDELGRGTATSDGLALAQATIEYLHSEISPRTIFATHFYELTELEQLLARVKNYSVASVEKDNQIIFTHQIIAGPANCSYGLEVARMAGLPEILIERAQQLLNEYAKKESAAQPTQLSFFESKPARLIETATQRLNSKLADLLHESIGININELTPLQSMQELDRILRAASELLKKEK